MKDVYVLEAVIFVSEIAMNIFISNISQWEIIIELKKEGCDWENERYEAIDIMIFLIFAHRVKKTTWDSPSRMTT